jgi:bacterioferritin-associated ferredoxin
MEARRRLIAAHAEGRGAGNLWHPEGFFVGQAADSIHHSEPKAEPWTVVCRCEDVNLAAIHAAIDAGARSPDDVKRLTRSGMGLCQWRGCRGLVSEVISARLGIPISSVALPNIRFPLRPVRIGALLSEERGATSAAQLPAHLDERA